MFETNSSFIFEDELFRDESSRGGLREEGWSVNRLHSAQVDRIPLGETIPAMYMFYVYMVPTLTDVCYKQYC